MDKAVVAFGWQLYVQLLKSGALSGATGAFFSPLSVYLALVLVLNGAGPLSQTHKELWGALTQAPEGNMTLPAAANAEAKFNTQTVALWNALVSQSGGNGTQLVIANGIWSKQLPISKQFADAMWKLYQAPVKEVNNTDPINRWSRDKTNGRITQAVPPGTQFDVIITNAVYFKALWEYAFDPDETMDQDFITFTNNTQKRVSVKMMYRLFRPSELTGSPVMYGQLKDRFRAAKLPYKGSTIVAYAVLPDAEYYKSDVDAAAADISPQMLFNRSNWRTVYSINRLEVTMPRFKISTDQVALKSALMAVGIQAALDADVADFSRMSEQPLFITNAVQSTFIQVDEKGTEAAAVTSMIMTTTAFIEDSTPPLVFDRPFLFWIVDESTQTVLFQGTVKDPSKSIS